MGIFANLPDILAVKETYSSKRDLSPTFLMFYKGCNIKVQKKQLILSAASISGYNSKNISKSQRSK